MERIKIKMVSYYIKGENTGNFSLLWLPRKHLLVSNISARSN